MFTLKEFVKSIPSIRSLTVWEGLMACAEGSATSRQGHFSFDGLKVYGFLLVRQGSMLIRYGGHEILYRQGEMQTYVPYMPVATLEYSDDFDGIALFFDTTIMQQSPMYHRLFRDAYDPLQSCRDPKIILSPEATHRIGENMQLIHLYLAHPSANKGAMLYSLCGVFLFDLLEEQGKALERTTAPNRSDELMQRFLSMVNSHYIEEHELPFYAEELCITTTYLSRLVRQIFDCTAKDIINKALLSESEYLLRTTQLTIAQIADQLHFADQSSFNHFFARHKGMSPSAFRKKLLQS
ncbi:MAG: AraC family transcriptional regulator [Bacteroidales bacterium]|nr:AraC family transcriptional regulator [Bacteroidales bacterium]